LIAATARSSSSSIDAPRPGRASPSRAERSEPSLPDIGRSWADQFRDEPDMVCPGWDGALSEPDAQIRTTWVDLKVTRALLYADCDEPTVAAAVTRLRPQANCGAVPFSLAEFPAVSCTSVVCSEDRILGGDWAKRIARDRLGADLIELLHSPFLSRPSALAEVLLAAGGGRDRDWLPDALRASESVRVRGGSVYAARWSGYAIPEVNTTIRLPAA
jgi:hypothetical protein